MFYLNSTEIQIIIMTQWPNYLRISSDEKQQVIRKGSKESIDTTTAYTKPCEKAKDENSHAL